MEVEYNIAGRILAKDGTRVISLAEILASPEAGSGATCAADLSEDVLSAYCKAVSAQNACKVYLWKDREEYGNANVFNGGSDYEIVNEVCFLCIYDSGREVLRERTNYKKKKIDAVVSYNV